MRLVRLHGEDPCHLAGGSCLPVLLRKASEQAAPCALCGALRVLVGRADDGREICGPCCGTDIDFVCRRCGFPGDIYADGCCTRCIVRDRVHDLLAAEDGEIVPELAPLAEALTATEVPDSVRSWLRRSPSARLLATLAAGKARITHDLLDDLPQDQSTKYVRDLLVSTRVLPPRQESLVRLELWFRKTAEDLSVPHRKIISPFAEWCIIRDARWRAARGRYSVGAATADRNDIRGAIEFIAWLDASQTDITELAQPQLDLWLSEAKPTRRRATSAFIRWTNKRRLTQNLEVPGQPRALPATFLDEQEHEDQLRRCLTDKALPLELRIAGALIRLYGLSVIRIVHLTIDRFHQDDHGSYFTFDKNPVLLPPTLARLIEQQITTRRMPSALKPARSDDWPAFLLPGRHASRPRTAAGLAKQLRQHGLPSVAARNTALFATAG